MFWAMRRMGGNHPPTLRFAHETVGKKLGKRLTTEITEITENTKQKVICNRIVYFALSQVKIMTTDDWKRDRRVFFSVISVISVVNVLFSLRSPRW
jgi:hypothetical protein